MTDEDWKTFFELVTKILRTSDIESFRAAAFSFDAEDRMVFFEEFLTEAE